MSNCTPRSHERPACNEQATPAGESPRVLNDVDAADADSLAGYTEDARASGTSSLISAGPWGRALNTDHMGALVGAEQPVYTAVGARKARDLVGEEIVVLVHDPGKGRYAARRAWVVPAGHGPLARITANGDDFIVGASARMGLAQGGRESLPKLDRGRRLFACCTYQADGYVRVNLRTGAQGKEKLHRLVAADVLGLDIDGYSVHHVDEDKLNNAPSNLLLTSQAEHAAIHAARQVEQGIHPFQLNSYPKPGASNPMHRDADFWKDEKKVKRYRRKQRERMADRDPRKMQEKAVRRNALNTGHKIRDAGYVFETMADYLWAHEEVIGRIGTRQKKIDSLNRLFGGIEGFNEALDAENHHLDGIEDAGDGERYAIVVSSAGGPPLQSLPVVIWPMGATSPFGSGIVIYS